jgi:hypothetical protein
MQQVFKLLALIVIQCDKIFSDSPEFRGYPEIELGKTVEFLDS